MSHSSSPLLQYWDAYLAQLEKNPVQTKSLTAGSLSVVSDVLAQTLTGTSLRDLSMSSLRDQFLIGLLIRGPVVHFWYEIMSKIIRSLGVSPSAESTTPVVLAKVALDQAVFSPPFNLSYFYIIGLMQGMSTETIRANVARDFIPLMLANYKVWPIVNLVNFKFVPAKLQVLFGNLVSIAWMCYVIKLTAAKK